MCFTRMVETALYQLSFWKRKYSLDSVVGEAISLLGDQNKLYNSNKINWGTRWRSWFRHCASSRKVAGSIPDGVIGIFH